jgi:hypothetical protein
VPQTAVGKTSEFNKIQFTGEKETGTVSDHGLFTDVSNSDIDDYAAIGDHGLLLRNTQSLRNVMLLRKEVDIAKVLQDVKNYSKSKTYAAANSWANASSDPMKDLEDAIDAAVVAFNRMWMSSKAFLALKRHPKVIARFYHGSPTAASVTLQDIADELGLDKIVIGQARVNTAEPGKDPVIEKVFGANAGLFVHEEQVLLNSAMSFVTNVYKPTEGQNLASWVEDLIPGKAGVEGGKRIYIGEMSANIVQGTDLGFLFQNVTAA